MSEPRPPAPPAFPVVSGARAILTAQLAKLVFRLVSAAVLARLLSPGDYGLQGMAAVIYSLLFMVRDLGVFAAVQQPDLTPRRFNALCRLAFLGGVALALTCVLLGRPAAWFFAEPRLPLVLGTMGLAFLFGGCAVPPLAVLYREHRVGAAMAVDVAATVVSSLAAIAAAAAGFGVWSLVLMVVLSEAISAVLAWGRCPRRPGLDTTGTRWSEVLGFGASLTGHNVAGYLARTVDQVVVGRFAGAPALGLYGRGAQTTTALVQLTVAPFSGWAIALLTRARDDAGEFVRLFRRLLNGLLHFCAPAAVGCLVAPEFVVRLLYGENWLAATETVRWLGLASLVQPWLSAQSWLLLAVAQARRLLAASLLGLGAVTLACLAARHQEIGGIARAATLGTIVHAACGLALCLDRTPVRWGDMVRPAAAPLLLHGGLGVVLLGLKALPPGAVWWLPLPAGAGYYALAWLALPGVRREIRAHFLFHP